MTLEEVNKFAEAEGEDIIAFSNPDYKNSILGISVDNRLIYDYDLMIKDLMETEDLSEIEAIEFIEYNTIRALSYYENAPIILQVKSYDE